MRRNDLKKVGKQKSLKGYENTGFYYDQLVPEIVCSDLGEAALRLPVEKGKVLRFVLDIKTSAPHLVVEEKQQRL